MAKCLANSSQKSKISLKTKCLGTLGQTLLPKPLIRSIRTFFLQTPPRKLYCQDLATSWHILAILLRCGNI